MTRSTTPMTSERWRAVDQILHGALVCAGDQREEFIANSCGTDSSLRAEVSSLLAACDATPPDFLERPAIEEHGVSSTITPSAHPVRPATHARPGRLVSARVGVYATAAGLTFGSVAGWNLARSATIERWRGTLSAIRQQVSANASSVSPIASSAEPTGAASDLSLVVVDRGGRVMREISANRPWAPRFSLDGRRIAYGALGDGRRTSDIWISDVNGGAARRLTDDGADNSHPQWSPDGSVIAYAVNAQSGSQLAERSVDGGQARIVAARPRSAFPTDWLRNGSALLLNESAGTNQLDILVQPADGSAARAYASAAAQEISARISPHTHWVAYASNESGREEVYVDSYPRPGNRVTVSRDDGGDPVWRGDGRELYYWRGDALVAVPIDGSREGRPPVLGAERVLFYSAHEQSLSSTYDVSPDGEQFVIVRRR